MQSLDPGACKRFSDFLILTFALATITTTVITNDKSIVTFDFCYCYCCWQWGRVGWVGWAGGWAENKFAKDLNQKPQSRRWINLRKKNLSPKS